MLRKVRDHKAHLQYALMWLGVASLLTVLYTLLWGCVVDWEFLWIGDVLSTYGLIGGTGLGFIFYHWYTDYVLDDWDD